MKITKKTMIEYDSDEVLFIRDVLVYAAGNTELADRSKQMHTELIEAQ